MSLVGFAGISFRLVSALMLLALAGCTMLKPAERADEFTAAPADSELWSALLESAPADSWYRILNDGPTALDWRLRAIDSATGMIDLQTFLWSFDTVGTLVLSHLVDAADRGVRIRILIDDSFLMHEDPELLALAAHPNIQYRIYNPFNRRGGGAATRMLLNLGEFGRLDHRMHNKAMVVDNRIAIVGGRNLADEYFGLDEDGNFRDIEVFAGGAITLDVSQEFDTYWNSKWALPIDEVAHSKADPQTLATIVAAAQYPASLHAELDGAALIEAWREFVRGADTGATTLFADRPAELNPDSAADMPVDVANELLTLFDNANSEIIIVSAYLIPTPDLEGAVAAAVERGVRVRILTNSLRSNNHLTAHSAYRNHVKSLLEEGAELHEVRIDARDRDQYMLSPIGRKKLALHAKGLIIDDDKIFIGSANLDPRSLKINTEMGFLIESETLNAKARALLEGDFSTANSWQLGLDESGSVIWVSDDATLKSQPANSFMHRIEDWFFSLLPLEGEL
jgi:putative cardiolipin synthase